MPLSILRGTAKIYFLYFAAFLLILPILPFLKYVVCSLFRIGQRPFRIRYQRTERTALTGKREHQGGVCTHGGGIGGSATND